MSDQDGTDQVTDQGKNSMTTLWLDGFDTYGLNVVTSYTLGSYELMDFVYSRNEHPRTGPMSAFLGGGSSKFLGKRINAGNTIVVGCAFYPNASGYDRSLGIVCCDAQYLNNNPLGPNINTGEGIRLWRTATNNIKMVSYIGAAETDIYESSGNELNTNTYSYIELALSNTLAGSAWEIRLNGNTVLASGALGIASDFAWVFLATAGGINQTDIWADDFYITNDEFLSSQRCYTQFVASDQAPQDWTLSSGADAFELLDDPTYNIANYIQGDKIADISAFGIDAVPVASGVVNAIRLTAAQNLTDAGSGNTQQAVNINAVDYVGDEHVLTTSPIWYDDVFDLTGVTLGHIAALTMQVEKTA